MFTRQHRNLILPLLAVVALTFSGTAWAQGTANGPQTGHNVDPGPVVLIGNAANPMPIDLDPNGPPWTKRIFDPNFLMANGGPLQFVETIRNVGTEPWHDWHEHILPDPTGALPAVWAGVTMSVNGNPIGFNVIGLGSPDLWLDQFTQPVLPGDILEIKKVADVFPTPGVTSALMVIEEYPTPEPASLALVGLGALGLLKRNRKEAL